MNLLGGKTGDCGTQLLRAAAPGGIRWVSPLDQGKTTLMRRSLIMRWGGPRSEPTQLMSEVDRFLPGKSPKCLRL